ncbi:hypothetical protein [Arthrobacter sp. TMS1-12-1]
MPHLPTFMPADLQIVTQAELLVLERVAAARAARPPDGGGPSSTWPDEPLDGLLDELERREVVAVGRRTRTGRVS